MTDKKIPITKSTRDAAPLIFAERGLLAYMLDNLNPQGQFHQPLQKTAEDNGSTRPTVHRLTQGLIQKHAVKVASPAFRGSDGWMIPPVLIPIPQVEQVTDYPVPNGTQNQTVLETGTSTVCKPLDIVHRELSTRTVIKVERGLQDTRPAQQVEQMTAPAPQTAQNVDQAELSWVEAQLKLARDKNDAKKVQTFEKWLSRLTGVQSENRGPSECR